MGQHEDFLKGLAKDKSYERNDAFEVSTLKEVLGQLGWAPAEIRTAQEESPFTWAWFNGENLIRDTVVESHRIEKFNFLELLTKSSPSHPIREVFAELKNRSDGLKAILIFKVYDMGRWLITDLDVTDRNHIHIAIEGGPLRVFQFAKFFKEDA